MLDSMKAGAARVGMLTGATAGIAMLGFFLAGSASAQGDPIETAFTDMEGKVTTYGGAIVALVVIAAAIFLGIKYLKKGVSKA